MGFYDTEASIATQPHEQKTAYPRLDFVESGLRLYNPAIGRWCSKDPIGEKGGLNLYGFVGNEPVGNWDYLGLKDCKVFIWIGHTKDIRPELEKDENRDDKCIKHFFIGCQTVLLTDDEYMDNPVSDDEIGGGCKLTELTEGGGLGGGAMWGAQEEIEQYVRGGDYLQGYEDYKKALFWRYFKAAKQEAAAMSLNKDLMNDCCCDEVIVEIKRVRGWNVFIYGKDPWWDAVEWYEERPPTFTVW